MLLWFGGGPNCPSAPYCVQGSSWLGDWVHACFRVAREKTGEPGLLLQGVREIDCEVLCIVCGVNLSPHPVLHCVPLSVIGSQQSSTWGQCQVFNYSVPQLKKKGALNAKDYYSKAFLLLFFSIRTASVLDPNGELMHFKKKNWRRSRARKGGLWSLGV